MNACSKISPEGLIQREGAAGGDVELESAEDDMPSGVAVVADLQNLIGPNDRAAGVRHVGA
jgi:hypothetical protein